MSDMEKYAVIKLASKQYLVREGDVIELERQEKPLKIEVLFYSDGSKNTIGEPEVNGVSVKATVLEEKLGKKVRVARFYKKSRHNRVRGHRQPINIIKIEKIGAGTKGEEVSEKKVEKAELVKTTSVKKTEAKEKSVVVKEKAKVIKKPKTAVSKVAKPAVKAKKTAPAKKVSPKTEDRKLKGSK